MECDKCIYKPVAVKCSSAINKYHAAKELELIRKNNVGSFYNYVNEKLSSSTVISDIRQPDGSSLCTDNVDKCTVFNDFFASVFTSDNGTNPDLSSRVDSKEIHLDSVTFTPELVYATLKRLKPTTSAGPDNIPNLRVVQMLFLSHTF